MLQTLERKRHIQTGKTVESGEPRLSVHIEYIDVVFSLGNALFIFSIHAASSRIYNIFSDPRDE